MFNQDFYPTPLQVRELMTEGETLTGAVCLEPSAGKADLVKHLQSKGAEVIACEKNDDLRKIVEAACQVIASDFLTVTGQMISHVTHIFMNPPFSADEKHILHAWDIAPEGCVIVALCNSNTLEKLHTQSRERLAQIVGENGRSENLGNVFNQGERYTNVNVSMIRIEKPRGGSSGEFSGFFMEEEPESAGSYGIMPYNLVRDIVNRYVSAVRMFDEQLETAVKLNDITGVFFKDRDKLSIQISRTSVPVVRSQFKKEMQKSGWLYIFEKMNLDKYATKGLKEDINKFVEKQQDVPFTMRNIYKMLEIVIGTTGSRMDKAIVEVFDRVTKTYKENRYNLEGWATNSHYLLTRRFIVGNCIRVGYNGKPDNSSSYHFDMIEDLVKALCFVTGDNYSNMVSLRNWLSYDWFIVNDQGHFLNEPHYDYDVKICGTNNDTRAPGIRAAELGGKVVRKVIEWGQWFDWGYFRARVYKKGTLHLEFKSEEIWQKFNQRVAQIKGYPLPEKTKRTHTQRETEVKPMQRKQAEVLFEI